MDTSEITAFVSLLIALSVAAERLVEIFKGFVPVLEMEHPDPRKESMRKAMLQILAVIAGIVTVFLANPLIPREIHQASGVLEIIGMGLLVSGGSGFWNSVLTYVTKVKDIKKFEAAKMQHEAGQ